NPKSHDPTARKRSLHPSTRNSSMKWGPFASSPDHPRQRCNTISSTSMLLLLDNYDSFTYNLAQYFGELGCELLVKRNDEISIDEIAALAPRHICISPGPCTPREAGISKDVVLRFGGQIPILGVCLGHQCIAEAYGGKIIRAPRLMHGKSSMISHNGSALFVD